MSQGLQLPVPCCLSRQPHTFLMLVWPTPLYWGAMKRETGDPASHLTASAQVGNSPMRKGRGLPWLSQELPEKYSVFHMGSPLGISAAADEIPALLPGVDLCNRLSSMFQPIFPLKFIPGWLLTVHYFILSNPFLFVYL